MSSTIPEVIHFFQTSQEQNNNVAHKDHQRIQHHRNTDVYYMTHDDAGNIDMGKIWQVLSQTYQQYMINKILAG